MAETFGSRIKNAWNAFRSRDQTSDSFRNDYGIGYTRRPDRVRLSLGNERSIVAALYNRIAIDVAAIKFQHVRVDDNECYVETIHDPLNECLTLSSNLDQTARAFFQDAALTLFDEGCIALVPVDTSKDPNKTGGYDVYQLRVGRIVEWYPSHVRIDAYDERDGRHHQFVMQKDAVAIIENPLYAVMNEPNSQLRRLIRKLNLLDGIDEQTSSGKLDIIIQVPYSTRTEAKQKEAERRRAMIEEQLAGSKYGIAYIDATERVTQLNRAAENNLLHQIEYLMKVVFNQIGVTEKIFYGEADEQETLNYHNRTIEPIVSAFVDGMTRSFLSKTARTQGQRVMFFRDPFKLVPVTQVADIADKFTRNEIFSSNEVRAIVGRKPVDDPRANELRNKNLNTSEENPAGSGPLTSGNPTEEVSDFDVKVRDIIHSALQHSGVKGMKWGVQNGPPYPLKRGKAAKIKNIKSIPISASIARDKASRVHAEVEKYKKGGPAGNQNCQLCTWSMEMQFRGENMLPRPVYSPRDIELSLNGYEIVKNPIKIPIKGKDDITQKVLDAGDGARFYTHVNWRGSTGGHEFITMNIGGECYVVDGQAGIVSKIGSKAASQYFDSVNYKNSFVVRIDDKEINRDILKYNDRKYLTEWDHAKDIQYMYENDMLSETELEEFGLSKRKSKNNQKRSEVNGS